MPNELLPGQLVALQSTKYSEKPLIGKVIDTSGQHVNIRWYDGAWTTKWREYTYKVGKKTHKWNEKVPIKDIILRNVQLTNGMKLTSKTRRELESLYH